MDSTGYTLGRKIRRPASGAISERSRRGRQRRSTNAPCSSSSAVDERVVHSSSRPTRSGRHVEIRDAEPSDAAALLAYFKRIGGETPHLTFGEEGVPLS